MRLYLGLFNSVVHGYYVFIVWLPLVLSFIGVFGCCVFVVCDWFCWLFDLCGLLCWLVVDCVLDWCFDCVIVLCIASVLFCVLGVLVLFYRLVVCCVDSGFGLWFGGGGLCCLACGALVWVLVVLRFGGGDLWCCLLAVGLVL